MKKGILKFICKIISILIRTNFFLKLFNRIYEMSSQKWINVFHQYVKFPNNDFEWVIYLKNGKKIKTNVYASHYKTLQLAIDYKWYAPGMSIIENEIIKAYSNELTYADIGSNLGIRSLNALSSNKKVYMFEPNNELLEFVKERCILNNFNNYQIIPKAVSNDNKETVLHVDGSSYLSSIQRLDNTKYEKVITVKTITIDSFFNNHDIQNMFIKIDVEGHEREVIEGGKITIIDNSPTLLIEINKKESNFNEIFTFLIQQGYSCFAHHPENSDNKLLKQIKSVSQTELVNSTNDFLFINNSKIESSLNQFVF